MKKLLFISIALFAVLLSCDKTKQVSQKLDGTWKVYSYTQITSGGFEETLTTNGTITFSTQKEGSFKYEENYSFDSDTGLVQSQWAGTGMLQGTKKDNFSLMLSPPNNSVVENGKIYLITKRLLKIGFHENGIAHRFVLQRN